MKLIQEKKAEVLKAASDGADAGDALRSRDLLTLLIKANMSEDVPEDRRLSDEDVLARAYSLISLYVYAHIMCRGADVSEHSLSSRPLIESSQFLHCRARDDELRHRVRPICARPSA